MASKSQARAQQEKLHGLKPNQAARLRQAMRLVAAGERLMAGQALYELAQALPSHPEVLRLTGIHHANQGEWAAAAQSLGAAAALRPGDFAVMLQLAVVQNHAADFAAGLLTLSAAAPVAVSASQCLALSVECDRQGHIEQALTAVQRALALEPAAPVALLQRARCLKALGQAQAAAADCRELIARRQLAPRAWFSLLDLKTVPLAQGELAQLQCAAEERSLPIEDLLLLDFALGKALEDDGQHALAFEVFTRANRTAAAVHPWDGAVFTQLGHAVQAAFGAGGLSRADAQGTQVIFLVGLPRSGTTLVEQVLASHSQVEGSSELPYLQIVVDEESRRRGLPFPAWVPSATAADWTRMGQHYLRLSARWRTQRPRSTDKLPGNWLLAGAALAMLPDARVVDCRRDAVETCWSCYKQLFGPGQAEFTYGADRLAAYWHGYRRLSGFWAAQQPERFRVQHYEQLVADTENQVRDLLVFCGLSFEPGCLRFHEAQRAIRTPSALQVRQPLRRASTPAASYGALLGSLRADLQGTGVDPSP